MKKTPQKIIFGIMSAVFYLAVPIIIILVEYLSSAEVGNKYSISFMGLLAILIVFWVFKRVFINKRLANYLVTLAALKGTLEVETDKDKIANAENAIKRMQTVETTINSVLPILACGVVLYGCHIMEQGIAKFSGAVGFCLISFIVGFVFIVLESRQVVSRHLKKVKNEKVD